MRTFIHSNTGVTYKKIHKFFSLAFLIFCSQAKSYKWLQSLTGIISGIIFLQ